MIQQLPKPCLVLTRIPDRDDLGEQHFYGGATERVFREQIAAERVLREQITDLNAGDTATVTVGVGNCFAATCDKCGTDYVDPDMEFIQHRPTRQELVESMETDEWTITPAGETWCWDCGPAGP